MRNSWKDMTRTKYLTRLMSIFFQFPFQEFVTIYWSAYHRKVTRDIVSHGVLMKNLDFYFATYKHSLIWLISVRDLKGLLFFAWIFIPIKDLLISMFSFSSWPRQNFTSLMKLLYNGWKENGMCIKKVYWIIGINIYESRIAYNTAVSYWFSSSHHT